MSMRIYFRSYAVNFFLTVMQIFLLVCGGCLLPELSFSSSSLMLRIFQWVILLLLLLHGIRMVKRQYDIHDRIINGGECEVILFDGVNGRSRGELIRLWAASEICARGSVLLFFLLGGVWLCTFCDPNLLPEIFIPEIEMNSGWVEYLDLLGNGLWLTLLLLLTAVVNEFCCRHSLKRFQPLPESWAPADLREKRPPWYFLSLAAQLVLLLLALRLILGIVSFGESGKIPAILLTAGLYGVMAYFEAASGYQQRRLDAFFDRARGQRTWHPMRAWGCVIFLLFLFWQFPFLELSLSGRNDLAIGNLELIFPTMIPIFCIMLMRQMLHCRRIRKQLRQAILSLPAARISNKRVLTIH